MRTRELARTALAIVAGVFAATLLVQIFLAGLGVFDGPSSFATHREFGYSIGLLILVMLVLALVGRVGAGLIGLVVLLAVQMTLQSVFVGLRGDYPSIAALHPVNGVLMLFVTIILARRSWAIRATPAPSASPEPPSPASSEIAT